MASAGLNVARQLGHSRPRPLDTYGHVMDEFDDANRRLAAVDAIMQARRGPPPERPSLNVWSA